MGDDEITRRLHDVAACACKMNDVHAVTEDCVVAAYTAGASIAAIAEATTIDGNGVGQYTYEGVRQILLRRSVTLRPRGRPAVAD